ncbi:MAG: fibronectin type III domain-containing protein, partial [Chloroflexota bacterium]|nr:fibronectin type III domain-containing protein [Chloroflexota bacterium]
MPPPTAPTNLAATASSSSQISVVWSDNSNNETGFKVERGPATGGPWTQIGTTTATSYSDSGLASSTTYYYRVRAYGPSGDSGYSNTSSATTLVGAPAAPSGLSATAISSSRIDLSWVDNSPNESGFKIERNVAGGAWAQVATSAANANSYSNSGLLASTAYSYRVRAYNTAGDSAYSNTASATTPASVGAHVWSRDFGGPGSMANAIPLGVAVDVLGEISVVGYIQNTVDLGTGLLTSAGGADIFVARYSSAGTPLWSMRIGSSSDDRAKAVAVDDSGNIFVTGFFRGTVDFGGGPVSAQTNAANAFLAKYSPAGIHLWSKRLSTGSGLDEGTALAVDAGGNVLVGGILYQTSDFGGGPLTTAGGADIFLAKYSASGAHSWSKRMGGAGEDWVYGLAVNGSGGPALTGSSVGSADLGGGVIAGAGGKDIIVAQYSSTGAHVWARRVGGSADDSGRGVAVDGAGNLAVTGNFASTSIDFGSGALA